MFMTAQEVANVLRLSRTTVLDPRWRVKVGLDVTRVGGKLLFEEADVQDLIQRGKKKLPVMFEHDGLATES